MGQLRLPPDIWEEIDDTAERLLYDWVGQRFTSLRPLLALSWRVEALPSVEASTSQVQTNKGTSL